MNKKFTGYRCSLCNRFYEPEDVTYICPIDDGNLDILIDTDRLGRELNPNQVLRSREASLWRYLPLLPVDRPRRDLSPLHAAGWTPIFFPERLSKELKIRNLWVKDESRNPTASFKDRASVVVVTRAMEIGSKMIVTASTGNAGAALAGMSAAVGQPSVIFAPRTAPEAKIAQLLVYGAKVILVDGTYDDAFDLTIKASDEFGWYCRNTGYNPFTAEGKKTAAYEIWEWFEINNPKALAEGQISIFIPVGDGNIISGIHKGFKDLYTLGWIPHIPKLFGVQAEGSAAIANTFNAGTEKVMPVAANTLADSISVDLPRDGIRAVRAVRETGGRYIVVKDEDILSAISILGKDGIFAEPAGAASMAGLIKAFGAGNISVSDFIVVLNTGSGLKDINAAMNAVPAAPIIEPTIKALKRVIQ